MLGLAQERSKTRVGIEARPTKPVDRTIAPDERRRTQVADHCIIFNAQCHGNDAQTLHASASGATPVGVDPSGAAGASDNLFELDLPWRTIKARIRVTL